MTAPRILEPCRWETRRGQDVIAVERHTTTVASRLDVWYSATTTCDGMVGHYSTNHWSAQDALAAAWAELERQAAERQAVRS